MGEEVSSKEQLSPILRQNVARPIRPEEGPNYGEPLAGLGLRNPITRRRFFKIAPPAVALGLVLAVQAGEAAKIDLTSAAELGPTPRVLPTPGETSAEMEEFKATIEAINQEPGVVMSQVTPTAAEVKQEEKETSVQERVSRTHLLRSNEDLFTLSRLYGIPWQAVYVKNFDNIGNNLDSIEVGDELIIPNNEEINFVEEKLNRKGLDLESITCEGPYYFHETGHYVRSPVLKFFQAHGGEAVIGAPISENIGNTLQFFEKMAIMQYGSEEVGFMNIGEINMYILNGEKPPEKGEFSLDQRFTQLYQAGGGEENLGYVITDILEENGISVQYTQNARLEFDPRTNEVRLGDLGREFTEGWKERQKQTQWSEEKEAAFEAQAYVVQCDLSPKPGDAFYEARRAFEEFLMIHPEIMNQLLIERLYKEDPERFKDFFHRAQEVMIITDGGYPTIYPGGIPLTGELERDWNISKYHGGNDPENYSKLSFEQVLLALSKHFYYYENNPLVYEALGESRVAATAINKVILAKSDPNWFVNNEVPLLPEDWHGIFVFAGGQHTLGGGLSHAYPVIFGAYNEYDGFSPEDYSKVLENIAVSGGHELVHLAQKQSILDPSPSFSQSDEEEAAGIITPENRKYHLAHMAMCSLTAVGQEALGFDPGIEPRIIYIFSVLKREGVSDPYGEIVRAAITSNSDRLWKLYEDNRGSGDLSIDEILETNDPIPDFPYYDSEDFEAFREGYLSYLRTKQMS